MYLSITGMNMFFGFIPSFILQEKFVIQATVSLPGNFTFLYLIFCFLVLFGLVFCLLFFFFFLHEVKIPKNLRTVI